MFFKVQSLIEFIIKAYYMYKLYLLYILNISKVSFCFETFLFTYPKYLFTSVEVVAVFSRQLHQY